MKGNGKNETSVKGPVCFHISVYNTCSSRNKVEFDVHDNSVDLISLLFSWEDKKKVFLTFYPTYGFLPD